MSQNHRISQSGSDSQGSSSPTRSLLLLHPLMGFAEIDFQSSPTGCTQSVNNSHEPETLTQFHFFLSPRSEVEQQLFTAALQHPHQECFQKAFLFPEDKHLKLKNRKNADCMSHQQLQARNCEFLVRSDETTSPASEL